ncbi:MAG: hypothetical protein L6V87_08635 [Ruminococcus sp.]|nr:MAG: hypothetical protein L6V87_08635 [Ruminococcus sp.]
MYLAHSAVVIRLRLAVNCYLPRIRKNTVAYNVQQRGFSCTVPAQQTVNAVFL